MTPSLSPTAPTGVAGAAPRSEPVRGRRVTDAPTRVFHWLLALSFVGAYLTADGERWRALHVTLGYTMAGLLAARLLYGIFGPRQARLDALWRRLSGLPGWLRSMRQAAAGQGALPWRAGQNLLMAAVLALLLAGVPPLTLSGYATYDDWGRFLGGDALAELHEFLGEAYAAIVVAHLGLMAVLSVLRRRNLALPMLTGRSADAGPDLVRQRRLGLAAALAAAVLGFWVWQWQASPQGLVTRGALGGGVTLPGGVTGRDGAHDRSHDHDHDD